MSRYFSIVFLFIVLFIPFSSQAHEVYVLEPERVAVLENLPPVSFIDIFKDNITDTMIWGSIVGLLIVTIFVFSVWAPLEDWGDRYLQKLKRYAPFIARVTAGLAFVLCGYHNALFGPELPLLDMYGAGAVYVQYLLYFIGILMLLGIYTRIAGLIGLGFFAVAVVHHGAYMITYLNYLAELFVLILVGGHRLAIKDRHLTWNKAGRLIERLADKHGELAFLFLRVGFGVSLIYSAVYAKILHNQLALAVVHDFDLVSIFGFNPEFIVFGAGIIEILLGVFFILGLEIRFTAVVINIFLTLSLLYFGESVWPHVILIGIPIAFFCYGYDKYSLKGYFFKDGNREPIF